MRTTQKSKSYPGQRTPAPQPLDKTQFNAVMRNVFAWMTVGMGITATVASALLVSPLYPDLAGLIILIIAHLAIAFALDHKLRRFSPTQAFAFFLFYAALTGFTISTVFHVLFYPTISGVLANASTSVSCLFGLMTLIGWRTRIDLSRARSYVLMALLGLPLAFIVNKLLAGTPFDVIFSFFSVLLFSALAGGHKEPFNILATDPDLRIKPADSLRFSLLAALQLYLCAGNLIAVALSNRSSARLRYSQYHRHLPRHREGLYSAIGTGVGGFGSSGRTGIGSGGAGGGGSVGGGGGGGSFTP